MSEGEHIGDGARREATRWVSLLHSEVADGDVVSKFEEWLNASRENALAYGEAEQLWRDLNGADAIATFDVDAALADMKQPSVLEKLKAAAAGRRWAPAGMAAGLASVAVALFMIVQGDILPVNTPYTDPAITTEVAEIRDITLNDGTIVTLGAKSAIRSDVSGGTRKVVLVAGEAFFNVAKDASRPFYVEVDDMVVRVVGTQFDVKRGADRVHVAVLEGVVNVMRAGDIADTSDPAAMDRAPRKVLNAGERVVLTNAMAPASEAVIVEETTVTPGAWRDGRLVYENAPLAEVIADANRYYDKPIILASTELDDLSVVGSFRTGQIDQMLAGLELSQPVSVDRGRTDRVTIRPAMR